MRRSGVTHYTYDALIETVAKSPCGAYSVRHDYSERVEEVTCPKCLKALGVITEETTSA